MYKNQWFIGDTNKPLLSPNFNPSNVIYWNTNASLSLSALRLLQSVDRIWWTVIDWMAKSTLKKNHIS